MQVNNSQEWICLRFLLKNMVNNRYKMVVVLLQVGLQWFSPGVPGFEWWDL
jgi:hypothetical protein